MCMYKKGHRRFPEDKPPHLDLGTLSYQTSSITPAFLGGTPWQKATIQAQPIFATTIFTYSVTSAYQATFQNK